MKNKYILAVSVGLILLVMNVLLSMLFNALFPSLNQEYLDPAFRPWDDPLMSLFFAYPVALGILLTWLFLKTRASWKSGLSFGTDVGLLMSVPMFIVNFSSFGFSLLMVGSWALFGFILVLVAGLALERLEG